MENQKSAAQKAWDTRRARAAAAQPSTAEISLMSEFKVVAIRETPVPSDMALCDVPAKAYDYFQAVVAKSPLFNPEVECFVVLVLNTRRRVKGHFVVSTGTMDTLLIHAREVFRGAIIASA